MPDFLYLKTAIDEMKKLKKLCEESPKFKKRIIDIVLRGKFDGSPDENKKQLVGLVNKQNR